MKHIHKPLALLLTAALLLSLTACGASGPAPGPGKVQAADLLKNFKPQPVPEKQADENFIRAGYELAAKLFTKVYETETKNKTLLISPLSILTALAMTAGGAAGETLKEMENLLGSGQIGMEDLNAYLHTYLKSLPSGEKTKFSFANGIWFKDQEGFTVEESFLQKNVNYFEAAIRKAPFDASTVREINQWVEQHTDKMIPQVLDGLSEEARMVLINALVFDAKWQRPFVVHGPAISSFTNRDGKENQADYLYDSEWLYLENEECTGFMKPYEGDTYRFVALLPKDEKDFDAFVRGLSGEKLMDLVANSSEEEVKIKLPKFSYDYDTSLVEVLKSLGMQKAFESGGQADFSAISKDTPLYIGDVLHKTHIDLDSEGTKAAAVTTIILAAGSYMGPKPPKEVYLDRPFVYMIIDTATNLPLFMGTVTGFEG